jgi:hypothetical protein
MAHSDLFIFGLVICCLSYSVVMVNEPRRDRMVARVSVWRCQQCHLPFRLKAITHDATAVLIGLLIYAGFVIWLHGPVVGVPLLHPGA